jgi:DNA-binding PadR family transcriptional regulator
MDIRRETKLAAGTLYPILMRLEEAGWLGSRWEEVDPHEVGRPRRRLYRFTAVGARKARAAFGQFGAGRGTLAWS